MKLSILAAIGLNFVAVCAAQAAPCDVFYEVQPKDKLSDIAKVAYGSGDYQLIFSRNLDRLTSIANLSEGQELVIPCLPGELGRSPDAVALTFSMLPLEEFTSLRPSTSPVTTVSTNPSAPVRAEGGSADLALLTTNDSTGLAGENQPNGGVVPALVKRALSASNPTLGQVNLSFIDDRDAHVETLLPRAGFALSFPWRKPDCEQPARLTSNQQLLCRDFAFSDSIYTLAVSVFTNRGQAPDQAQGFGVLSTMKLCVSEPADLMVLKQGGARIPNENLRMTFGSSECFDLLASGEVDALVADASSVDQALLTRGDAQKFEEAPWLGGLSSVHAIAFKGNQVGMSALGQLNAGLDDIKTSGEWFDVIARQLSSQ